MPNYTISNKFIEFIGRNKSEKYVANILLPFVYDNPLKVVIDKEKRILDTYRNIIKIDNGLQSGDSILFWLEHMDSLNKFEVINNCVFDQSISSDEMFLSICIATANQHKMIVDSHNNWEFPISYLPNRSNEILFKNIPVFIYDKDEAILEIKNSITNLKSDKVMTRNTNNQVSNNTKPWWRVPIIIVAIIGALSAIVVAVIQKSPFSNKGKICYPITLIDKATSKPVVFTLTTVQLTVQRDEETIPLPITRSNCKYCPEKPLEPTEKVFLTLDNTDYQVIERDSKLTPGSNTEIYVEKKKK